MKSYAFYFHYNKPASLAAGEPRLSVHYRDQCHVVKDVVCAVPCHSRHKKTQPRCVMAGFAKRLRVCDNAAILDDPLGL